MDLMTLEEAILMYQKGYCSVCNDGRWLGFRVETESLEN